MKKVGITGGIGSGKSFVCNLFKKLYGIEIYNADSVVKDDIIKRALIKRQIMAEFGEDSYLPDGGINRPKFKKLLFNNATLLKKMNGIIRVDLVESMNSWAESKTGPYVLIECAVIFENGLETIFDKVMTVVCPMETRIERLLKRGVAQVDIDNIIKAQIGDDERVCRSNYWIRNDEMLSQRMKTIDRLLRMEA